MSRRSRPITLALSLFFLGGLSGACDIDLEDELEGEPCTVEEDCWKTQKCFRTPEEASLGIPGLCQPKGSQCVFGMQLGCGCNPNQSELTCASPARPSGLDPNYPRMVCDEASLRCVAMPLGGTSP